MLPYLRPLCLAAVALASTFFLTGCGEPGGVVYDRGGPAYEGGYAGGDYGDDVDVYYVGGRPYSHFYGGPLIIRDGGYYYSRGGGYAVYDRGYVRSHYHGGNRTSYRTTSNVNNVNVRNQYNTRGGYNRNVDTRGQYQARGYNQQQYRAYNQNAGRGGYGARGGYQAQRGQARPQMVQGQQQQQQNRKKKKDDR